MSSAAPAAQYVQAEYLHTYAKKSTTWRRSEKRAQKGEVVNAMIVTVE